MLLHTPTIIQPNRNTVRKEVKVYYYWHLSLHHFMNELAAGLRVHEIESLPVDCIYAVVLLPLLRRP